MRRYRYSAMEHSLLCSMICTNGKRPGRSSTYGITAGSSKTLAMVRPTAANNRIMAKKQGTLLALGVEPPINCISKMMQHTPRIAAIGSSDRPCHSIRLLKHYQRRPLENHSNATTMPVPRL